MCCVKYVHIRDKRASNRGIYVRKSREKSFWKKKPGNKNFGKKFRILSSPWKKCHWKKNPAFWIPGTFFPKKSPRK